MDKRVSSRPAWATVKCHIRNEKPRELGVSLSDGVCAWLWVQSLILCRERGRGMEEEEEDKEEEGRGRECEQASMQEGEGGKG
jgi:hypothetical protein